MTSETVGFGEQAVNKVAEMAIASQMKHPAEIKVQIKTDLNKLARGQLDSMAIAIYGLLLPQDLKTEEFHLHIGQITVKPLSAIRGKIKLVHPSEGTLRFVISAASFTNALNAQVWHDGLRSPHPTSQGAPDANTTLTPITCLLSERTITFTTALIQNHRQTEQIVLAVTPEISPEGEAIVFQDVRYVSGEEPFPKFTQALLNRMSQLLNLDDFAKKGMPLQIQQLTIDADKLALDAAAHIQQFPSS